MDTGFKFYWGLIAAIWTVLLGSCAYTSVQTTEEPTDFLLAEREQACVSSGGSTFFDEKGT